MSNNKQNKLKSIMKGLALKKIIALLLLNPAVWIPLVIALISSFLIIFTVAAWDLVTNVEPNQSGSFQNESTQYGNENKYNGDTIISSQLGIADAIAGVFYNRFSQQSYYVMIDNDPTIYQANSDELKAKGDIKDIDDRESQFALSPTMLQILDSNLNDGYKNPEQFIKPVYNSCMVEGSDKEDDGFCELLQLTDDKGVVVANSTYYRQRSVDDNPVTDVTGPQEGEHSDEVGIVYDRNDNATEKGIWNWGLGSIIHYKSFNQTSRINNYRITEVETWDPDARKKVSITSFDTRSDSEELIDKYGYKVPDRVLTKENEQEEIENTNNGLSLGIPEDETKYAIDKATTFAGSIENNLIQSWLYQGESQGDSTVRNYYYEYPSSMEETVNDPNAVRVAYYGSYGSIREVKKSDDSSPFGMLASGSIAHEFTGTVKWEPEEKSITTEPNPNCTQQNADKGLCSMTITKEEIVHPNQYVFSDGTIIEGDQGSLSFTIKYNPQLDYVKTGDLQTYAVKYVNTNPDTSNITGIDYIEDYIKNYESFVYDDADTTEFACLNTDVEVSEDGYTAEQLRSVNADIVDKMDYSSKVSDVASCPDNSLAAKTNTYGSMMKFEFDNMPEFQLSRTANLLGYIKNDDTYELGGSDYVNYVKQIDLAPSSEKENSQSEEYKAKQNQFNANYQKYGSALKKYAAMYGSDRNFLTFMTTIGSDENICNISQYIGETLHVYNFSTRVYDNLFIDPAKISDPTENIKYTSAILQKLLVEFKYNIPMAIEAFDIGINGVNNTLELYERETGMPVDQAILNTTDITWTDYLSWYLTDNYGSVLQDKLLIQKAAKLYIAGATITFQSALEDGSLHTVKTFNFNTANRADENSNIIANINKYQVNSMYTRVLPVLEDEWKTIFLNQKSYYAGSYSPAYADYIDETAKGKIQVNDIQTGIINKLPLTAEYISNNLTDMENEVLIKRLFTSESGRDYNELNVMSEDYWKFKFSSLFKTVGSKTWSSTVNIEDIFGEIPTSPVDSYVVDREFGYMTDIDRRDEFSNMLILAVMPGTEVRSVADGVVRSVENIDGEVYGKYIEIEHNKTDDNDGVIVRYSLLGEINVKKGDSVEGGQVIGKTSSRMHDTPLSSGNIQYGSIFGLVMTINDEYYDPMDIFTTAAEIEKQMNETEQANSTSSWWDTGVTPPDAPDMDYGAIGTLEEWDLSLAVDMSPEYGGRKSAGTWFYPNSSTEHPAMDWATAEGTPLYALSDALIIKAEANCQSVPWGGNKLGYSGCVPANGNRIVYIFQHTNGNYYMIKYLHISDITVSAGQFVSGGTTIAYSGNSGQSTGPHVHIDVINLGSNYADLQDCYNRWKGNEWPTSYYAYGQRCESNGGVAPCKERPDLIFRY